MFEPIYAILLLLVVVLSFLAGLSFKETWKFLTGQKDDTKVGKIVALSGKIFRISTLTLCARHLNKLPKGKLAMIDENNCYFCKRNID